MPRMPRVTAREAERAILRDGWVHTGGTGSHHQYRHPTKSGRLTLSFHSSEILTPKTLGSMLRQAGSQWTSFESCSSRLRKYRPST